MNALDQVVDGRHSPGNDMCLHFKAEARHADRVLNPLLPINDIATRYHMDYLAIGRDGNRSGNFDSPTNIVLHNITIARRDSHKAFAILRSNMAASDPYIRCRYLLALKSFLTVERRCNGCDCL